MVMLSRRGEIVLCAIGWFTAIYVFVDVYHGTGSIIGAVVVTGLLFANAVYRGWRWPKKQDPDEPE
jgi:hypothetical protein